MGSADSKPTPGTPDGVVRIWLQTSRSCTRCRRALTRIRSPADHCQADTNRTARHIMHGTVLSLVGSAGDRLPTLDAHGKYRHADDFIIRVHIAVLTVHLLQSRRFAYLTVISWPAKMVVKIVSPYVCRRPPSENCKAEVREGWSVVESTPRAWCGRRSSFKVPALTADRVNPLKSSALSVSC